MVREEANRICHTFDSFFCEWKGRDTYSLAHKTVFVEEFSMVPNKWITRVYQAYGLYGIKVYLFGDPNQCSPVEGCSQITYDYLDSVSINEMCDRIETLEYIPETCRYDKPTHTMLDKFLKYGRVTSYFRPIERTLLRNICYLNSTRIKVNTECCNRFTTGKRHTVVEFQYNCKKEIYMQGIYRDVGPIDSKS